jgi:hypothetical protein
MIATPFNVLSNVGLGIGRAIGKTGLGLGEATLRGVGAVTGSKYAKDRADELQKASEAIYSKPFEQQLQTKSGQLGTAIGGLAPYISGAGLTTIPKVLSAKTVLPYALKSGLVDTGINLAQTGGKDLKAAGITGATSAIASSIIPGGGITRRILSGTAGGYVGDVGSGLAGYRGEDRTGAGAFIPGLGTAIGTTMGGVNAYGYSKTPEYKQQKFQKTVDKRFSTLDGLQSNNKPLSKVIQKADKSGLDTKKFLAESDLLVNSIDKEGTIRTQNALGNLDETISPWENKVGETLQNEGKMVSVKSIQDKVDDVIEKSGLVGSAKQTAKNNLIKELEAIALEADAQGNVPLKLVHDLKVQTNQLNARSFLDPEKNAIGKTIGRGLKEFVEESTDAMDVRAYNKELQKLYGVRDVLKSLDGKKVLGGRMGKYFSETMGAIIGTSVGGIPGGIAGAEAGNLVRSQQLKSQFGGTAGIPVKPTSAMENALQSNLGKRQTNQATASNNTKNGIISTIPQPKNKSNHQSGKIATRPLMGAGIGSLAGFEKDENGNIKYNAARGITGALGGAYVGSVIGKGGAPLKGGSQAGAVRLPLTEKNTKNILKTLTPEETDIISNYLKYKKARRTIPMELSAKFDDVLKSKNINPDNRMAVEEMENIAYLKKSATNREERASIASALKGKSPEEIAEMVQKGTLTKENLLSNATNK